MNAALGTVIIAAIVIASLLWLIRVAKKFEETQQPEKKIKDKFKGRDLKKYMKAQHGY